MNTEHTQLKRATEKLVKSVGGIEAAASIVGKGKSTVGRWVNKDDAEHFINLADLHELEANSRVPSVTEALARMAGGVFIALPQMPGATDALPMHIMQIVKEFGELSERIREGMGDGDFSDRDARAALDELHDVERCLAELRLALTTMAESKPAQLRSAA